MSNIQQRRQIVKKWVIFYVCGADSGRQADRLIIADALFSRTHQTSMIVTSRPRADRLSTGLV